MPFFAADGRNEKKIPTASDRSDDPSRNEREAFLLKIHEVSFALDDLVLFLDTHPDDREAAGGIPFNACEFQSKGDAIADLTENLAADAAIA